MYAALLDEFRAVTAWVRDTETERDTKVYSNKGYTHRLKMGSGGNNDDVKTLNCRY